MAKTTDASGVPSDAHRLPTCSPTLPVGRYIVDAERLHPADFHALDGVSVFRDIGFSQSSFNELSGSLGMKLQVADRLLLDVNLLFAFDNHGVRDKVTPLLGFEYSF